MKALGFAGQAPPSSDVSPTWLQCLAIVGRSHGLNLTVAQLVKDNLLAADSVGVDDMLKCARQAGLKARLIELDFDDLQRLKKALPAIVKLKTGAAMVLTEVDVRDSVAFVVLRDPEAEEGATIAVDRVRLEAIWTGELALIRREYRLDDEAKPFGWTLVLGLFLRERRLLRDLVFGALALSLLALTPMLFWRILTSSVLAHRSFNTFTVLCVGVFALFVVEGLLVYLRHYLLQIVTARVDTKMAEIIFDRLLDLQIDFFERNPVGQISHDINESNKIRRFINDQGFGTLLDSLALLIMLPVMFAFSALLTTIVLAMTGLMVGVILLLLPAIRRATGAVIVAETAKGTFMYQNLAGIRTVKSLALETRQRAMWDVLVVRLSDALFHAGHISGTVQAIIRPLSQLSTSGALAVGVYQAMTTANPVAVGDLFAFMILIGRVQGPLLQMASLITQYDEARAAVGIVAKLMGQPKEEGLGGHGVRTPLKGHVEFARVRFKYAGALDLRHRRRQLRGSGRLDARASSAAPVPARPR